MTRTEQAVNIVFRRQPQPPPSSFQILAQRQALRAEIEHDRAQLELLRLKEIELRAALVRELNHLAYSVSRAQFKIETREWADGNPALDLDIERMQEAAEALMDHLEDIAHAVSQIEDKEDELGDAELWEQKGGAHGARN